MDGKRKIALIAAIAIDDEIKAAHPQWHRLEHRLHTAAAAVVAASNLMAEPRGEHPQLRVKTGAARVKSEGTRRGDAHRVDGITGEVAGEIWAAACAAGPRIRAQ